MHLAALCTLALHPTLRPALAYARAASTTMALEGVPPELTKQVVEAEARAASGRTPRVAGTAVLGLLAAASAAVAAGSLAGNEQAAALAEDVLPFGSAPLSLLLDAGVGWACLWVYAQEMQTRDENLDRIWTELQQRRAAAAGANRAERRAKKVARERVFTGGGGFAASPPPPPPPAPASSLSPPSAGAASEQDGSGLLASVKDFWSEANELGRAGALNLNAQLEEQGVLPALEPLDEAAGAVAGGDESPRAEAAGAGVASAKRGGGKKKRKRR